MSTINQTELVAGQFRNDERLREAKRMILESLAEHSSRITNIRPAIPELEQGYQETLEQFGLIRGGNLYFPYLASGIGNGPFVELADGSVKLDMITGIGVHGYGHSHPLLVSAGIDAAVSDTIMQGNLQQGSESFDLVKLLTDTANETGGNLAHCFLSTCGAMANENALKIAFQNKQPANRVIAFEHCFAGRTMVMSQITDKAGNRVGLPETIAVDYVPFFDTNDPAGSTQRSVERFLDHINRHPGKIAALWMELVQGEGGYNVGDHDFFKALIDVAHENNIAVIVDEVQTFGRTSRPFAFQHFRLDGMVDLVSIGKISQVCATLYTEAFKPKPGLISQTFTGSSWAIIAAKSIISDLVEKGHFGDDGKNVRLHNYFAAGLERISKEHPNAISGPFGVGGMVAFTPFEGKLAVSKDMVNRMYHAGLMSFIAGADPVRIRFLMPIGAITESQIDLACQIVEQIVCEMENENTSS